MYWLSLSVQNLMNDAINCRFDVRLSLSKINSRPQKTWKQCSVPTYVQLALHYMHLLQDAAIYWRKIVLFILHHIKQLGLSFPLDFFNKVWLVRTN